MGSLEANTSTIPITTPFFPLIAGEIKGLSQLATFDFVAKPYHLSGLGELKRRRAASTKDHFMAYSIRAKDRFCGSNFYRKNALYIPEIDH